MITMPTARKRTHSTQPVKTRKRETKRHETTFEEFKRDRARKPGGVRVTDNDGNLRFFFIIPQTLVSEFP